MKLDRDKVLALVEQHIATARGKVAECKNWSPVQAEWSRTRDGLLNLRDDLEKMEPSGES